MKTKRMVQGFVLMFVLVVSVTGCHPSVEERNKQHTPLHVYFNPLKLDMNVEDLVPYFVNYPTDWAKMGLRKHPMIMTYQYSYPDWGITGVSQYVFHVNGRLSEQRRTSFNVGSSGFDVITFEYDGNSNLVNIKSVYDGRYKRRYGDKGFVYDDNGRMTRRERDQGGNPGTWNYLYEYHENGNLKSISPERDNSLATEAGVTLYKLSFDSLARMARLETPKTTNMFLKDVDDYKKGKSVVTFIYSDYLCTQAIEKIPVKFDNGTETLTCTSNFTYNSHGDLATWTYSGGVYSKKGNSWRVDDMTFTISYDYEYDDQGNWTQAKMTLPDNIDEIPALRTFYKATKNVFTSNQDRSPSIKAGEKPVLTVARSIDYWADDAIASQNGEKADGAEKSESDNGTRYKGTGIYWLAGKVKSVAQESTSGNRSQFKFDQTGNLIYKDDHYDNGPVSYKYITPMSYHVSGWDDAVVNIKIENGKRLDVCSDASAGEELNHEYTFDDKGRLIEHKFISHMAYVTCSYQYKGENRVPSVMIEKHPEDGVTTRHYTYTQLDNEFNWTEREVSYTQEYDDYDDDMNYIGKKQTASEKYIEKRRIEYW